MRRPRIYFTELLNHVGQLVALDENGSKHLVQVLRLKTDAEIILFDQRGEEFLATLSVADKKASQATLLEHLRSEAPAALQITLAMGISRGERMDFSIQKAVELGVSHFQPLFTERCMVQLKGDRQQSRLDHWQGVIRHACEQSGRALLPSIAEPTNLSDWLSTFSDNGLMLDHRAEHSLTSLPTPKDSLTLLVGPEGGLSQAERDLALQHNFAAARMGPRVLRTETAPLAALAAIQTLWGDFR